MARFRRVPMVIEAVQWNVPDADGKVLLARDCRDHSAVRPTSYSKVAEILGTSGCSQTEPYWDWSVLGIIDTLEGPHIVSPGDWIVTGVHGEYYPCKPEIFAKIYIAEE